MFGLRSWKAVPLVVSKCRSKAVSALTQHVAILGEEGAFCAEVNTTPDHIERTKLGPVVLPRCCVVKDLSIVAVIRIGVRLPSWYSTQSDFRPREPHADHTPEHLLVIVSFQWQVGRVDSYPSFPLETTVTS